MDTARILESVLRGVLGGRRKRSRSALRYLVGGRGRKGPSFLTASRLLTLAGVAWGLYETWKRQQPGAGATVPPMDGIPAPPAGSGAGEGGAGDHLERLVRLSVAAARADGELSDVERQKILDGAREAGIEDLVSSEMGSPKPLASIVDGVADATLRRDLYVLAFTIVRADEEVNPKERAWLADLASRLALDASEVSRVETEAARAIDAAAGE